MPGSLSWGGPDDCQAAIDATRAVPAFRATPTGSVFRRTMGAHAFAMAVALPTRAGCSVGNEWARALR